MSHGRTLPGMRRLLTVVGGPDGRGGASAFPRSPNGKRQLADLTAEYSPGVVPLTPTAAILKRHAYKMCHQLVRSQPRVGIGLRIHRRTWLGMCGNGVRRSVNRKAPRRRMPTPTLQAMAGRIAMRRQPGFAS